jgi:hypothetical protein
MRLASFLVWGSAWAAAFAALSWTGLGAAAPVAHVLRIDPRASVKDGSPVVTAVIDLTESTRISEVIGPCLGLDDSEYLDCVAERLERPHALAQPVPLPTERVHLAVRIGDEDVPATYLSHSTFAQSQQEPGVGTAWLIALDADARMGKAFEDAKRVAARFVETLGPEDQVNIVILGPDRVVSDSSWLESGKKGAALTLLGAQKETVRGRGRTRPLLSLLKATAKDAFENLAPGTSGEMPLHQAMVVVSTGYGGGDPATTGPGAAQLSEFLTRGRLSEENTQLPKLPLPVVSIYVPPDALPEQRQIALDFMQNLANPAIGGFFTALRSGQGDHASRIVDAVRSRFANLVLARFRLSCIAPSATQSFSLLFAEGSPAIVGDSSFRDVPIGVDPAKWPLDVDVELTKRYARQKGGVYPGGVVRVFGNFCWAGDKARPEAYFLPPGEKLPQELGSNPEAARDVQKRLAALDMRGDVREADRSFVEFGVPESDQLLHGEGKNSVVRLVLADGLLRRTSGLTEATVLQLMGTKPPVPLYYYGLFALGALLAIAIVLLIVGTQQKRAVSATSSLPLKRLSRSPYMTPSPVTRAPRSEGGAGTRAVLEGPAGRFTLLAGTDLSVGRDGTRCAAVIQSPQVSSLHATFRFEQGKLMVKDESSTLGTKVDQTTITPGEWVELSHGDEIFLGPERLRVSLSRT